jgi:hypothetical protein
VGRGSSLLTTVTDRLSGGCGSGFGVASGVSIARTVQLSGAGAPTCRSSRGPPGCARFAPCSSPMPSGSAAVPSQVRPSMVVISAPSVATASVRQDTTRLSLGNTVQEPHLLMVAALFGPVWPIPSRNASSGVVRLSTLNRCVTSLTRNQISLRVSSVNVSRIANRLPTCAGSSTYDGTVVAWLTSPVRI